MSPGEYDGAAVIPFNVLLPNVYGSSAAITYVTHDKTYLYLATVFDRKSPYHPHDRIAYMFDNDNDGTQENGDDGLMSFAIGTPNVAYPVADFYQYNNGLANAGDTSDGGTNDVLSSFGVVGTTNVYETRHELDSKDDLHDFSIALSTAPKTIGMKLMVQLEADPIGSAWYVPTYAPTAATFCKLSISRKTTSITC